MLKVLDDEELDPLNPTKEALDGMCDLIDDKTMNPPKLVFLASTILTKRMVASAQFQADVKGFIEWSGEWCSEWLDDGGRARVMCPHCWESLKQLVERYPTEEDAFDPILHDLTDSIIDEQAKDIEI